MEAIMFAVGVLTMVLVALAALAVYSTVMVLKLKNKIEEQIRSVYNEVNHIHASISNNNDELHRRIDNSTDELHRRVDETNQVVGIRIDELQSYTDRRFDKLVDTYLLVKETEKESKKLIKG